MRAASRSFRAAHPTSRVLPTSIARVSQASICHGAQIYCGVTARKRRHGTVAQEFLVVGNQAIGTGALGCRNHQIVLVVIVQGAEVC